MKILRNEINGIFLLNKPESVSSNTALQQVKRIYNAKKAGHTGTLDPLATGLLPICFGEATKFAAFWLDADKEYIATVKLGETTTTYDSCGEIVSSKEVNCTKNEIISAVSGFLGRIWQTPPIYSALKVGGKPLYKYARSNEEVIIKAREITVFDIEVLQFISIGIFKLKVLCSKGTYIRALAHDIGVKLGCGAHLISLVRTKTSGFNLDKAVTLESITQVPDYARHKLLLPVDTLVSNLLRLDLDDIEFSYIKNGHQFHVTSENNIINESSIVTVRLYFREKFLGVASVANNMVKPLRLMRLCDI